MMASGAAKAMAVTERRTEPRNHGFELPSQVLELILHYPGPQVVQEEEQSARGPLTVGCAVTAQRRTGEHHGIGR